MCTIRYVGTFCTYRVHFYRICTRRDFFTKWIGRGLHPCWLVYIMTVSCPSFRFLSYVQTRSCRALDTGGRRDRVLKSSPPLLPCRLPFFRLIRSSRLRKLVDERIKKNILKNSPSLKPLPPSKKSYLRRCARVQIFF